MLLGRYVSVGHYILDVVEDPYVSASTEPTRFHDPQVSAPIQFVLSPLNLALFENLDASRLELLNVRVTLRILLDISETLLTLNEPVLLMDELEVRFRKDFFPKEVRLLIRNIVP